MIHFTNQSQFIAHYNAHAADPITESNLLAVIERAVWDDCEAYDIDCDSHRLIKFRGTVEFTDKSCLVDLGYYCVFSTAWCELPQLKTSVFLAGVGGLNREVLPLGFSRPRGQDQIGLDSAFDYVLKPYPVTCIDYSAGA